MKKIIRDNFSDSTLHPDFYWHNEPDNWVIKDGRLAISPGKSDFWARTHYGFTHDNGPCLFHKTKEDFIISTRVSIFPAHQYDQAGLMIRVYENFWLKTSVEYENEILSRMGVVVTNHGFSDWSTQDFDSSTQEIEFKVEKDGMDFLVHWRAPNESWSQLRIAHLHTETGFVQCGLYACCPIDIGFRAEFHFVEIRYI